MESVPGFVTIPRLAGIPRPSGVFFSAVVEAKVGPDSWKVRLDGRPMTVATALDLIPGQSLKLKLISQQGARWILQILAPPTQAIARPSEATPLMAAFLSRGLPLVAEKMAAWSRWLASSGVTDKEGWAASLETRGQGPLSGLAEGLKPWLTWLADLERGKSFPPPEEDYWDLWNARRTAAGDPWLVMPLRWEYLGQEDAGLLQAHWNPQSQTIDQWNLTACPEGTAFRLEARSRPGELALAWHFFDEHQRHLWEHRAKDLESALSTTDLRLSLQILGAPTGSPVPLLSGGIDVKI